MTQPAPKLQEHPYVVRTPGTCGGRARIAGTRIAVWFVVSAVVREGMLPEELVEAHPHLTLAQIYDALSYYYDHRAEVDRDLCEQDEAWPRRTARASR